MPFVWSDACLLHAPGGEVWIGRPFPGDEVPERAVRIREALVTAGDPRGDARRDPDGLILEVHPEQLVAFLRDAWRDWEAADYPSVHGQDRVVPYIFPTPG